MYKKVLITLTVLACIITAAYLLSPFRFQMPGKSATYNDSPALNQQELFTKTELERHIRMFSETIGERNIVATGSLTKAAAYIESEFKRHNFSVSQHRYDIKGISVANIVAEKSGTETDSGIIIIGGHYDSVIGSRGANDNASGIAAVIELARLLTDMPTKHTLRFVGFVNEEPPFFQSEDMGSLKYAKELKKNGENIVGMISIETIGSYYNQHNSQYYPAPLNTVYPDTGNFVAFVGNPSSKELLLTAISLFRDSVDFPSEGLMSPDSIPGVGWSDHWSFWQAGYPAIMITDTALYRYEHYHTEEDTIDKINFPAITQVVSGLAKVIQELDNQL